MNMIYPKEKISLCLLHRRIEREQTGSPDTADANGYANTY